MSTYEQFRTLAIIVPVFFLIALGFTLTLSSGTQPSHHGTMSFRSVASNLTRTVLMVGVCMVLLLGLQQLVGVRHP